MALLKKYDTYKSCIVRTPQQEFEEVFTSDWSFTDMRDWMIDTFCIDESCIIEIQCSSITTYKRPK